MAVKSDDTDACLGCHSCHDVLDGRRDGLLGDYDEVFEEAKRLTHVYWKRRGLM